MTTIGIIGTGAMGSSMIARLVETGHKVVAHDEIEQAREAALAAGADVADSLEHLAQSCRTIILSLPRAEIVEAVMAGLSPHLQAGSVILDTTTSDPETTKRLAQQADDAGYVFLDTPVSGGPSGARAGSMTMLVGGQAAALDKVRPVLACMTGKLVHVGPAGSAHAAKIANNLLCAANLVLVSEMAKLAERAGVPLEALLTGVNAGSGRSGVSEVNFPTWIQTEAYNSGFTMGLMRKDVGLATSLAGRLGLDLPGTKAIRDIWEDSRSSLADEADFNEIFKYEADRND